MTGSPFERNEHGVWCPSCGELLVAPWNLGYDNEDEWPDECRTCGYPEDAEKMVEYFT